MGWNNHPVLLLFCHYQGDVVQVTTECEKLLVFLGQVLVLPSPVSADFLGLLDGLLDFAVKVDPPERFLKKELLLVFCEASVRVDRIEDRVPYPLHVG